MLVANYPSPPYSKIHVPSTARRDFYDGTDFSARSRRGRKFDRGDFRYMNVVMKDCVFTDPRGDAFGYDMFFVQARNIRCVHIPPNIRIIPAIKEQLKQLSRPSRETKSTFKAKRVQQRQQEGLAAVKQILETKDTMKTEIEIEDENK